MKKIIPILLCLILALAFVACGGKKAATAAAGGPVRVKVALFNDGNALSTAQKTVFDAFVKENPGIIPEFQFITSDSYGSNWNGFLMKIQTMIASGNAPDVISLGLEGVGFMIMNDLAQPLDDYIAAHPEELQSIRSEGIDKELLKIFVVDGKLYGYPFEANSVVTHIRKDIFQKAGVALPPDNWTWDDFRDICAKIKAADTGAFAFAVPTNFFCLQALLYSNGAAPLNNNWDAAAINSPESVEVFQFLQDAIFKYGYAPQPSQTISETELVIQGRAAMQWIGRWVSNDYAASELYDTIYTQLVPAGKAGNVSCAGDACFVVLKSTKVPDAAKKVAIWCAGQTYVDTFLTTGSLPANQIFGEQILAKDRTIDNWKSMYQVYNSGQWRRSQDPPEYADLANIYGKYMDIIYSNQMPAKQALDLAAAEINQVFAESSFRKTDAQIRVVNSLFKN
ncbi:ABC transporter substrate-binding protein [Treponema primitia]|uniref:ABC transporter substrate-binding protein n=1 Tax=Treponema primitia TaxID=88058 RepID=UPI0002555171|nr:sugar ABC transporter substrate-binding protein [Treponema primitia]